MKIFPLTIYVLLKPFIQILPSDSKKSLWDSRTTATLVFLVSGDSIASNAKLGAYGETALNWLCKVQWPPALPTVCVFQPWTYGLAGGFFTGNLSKEIKKPQNPIWTLKVLNQFRAPVKGEKFLYLTEDSGCDLILLYTRLDATKRDSTRLDATRRNSTRLDTTRCWAPSPLAWGYLGLQRDVTPPRLRWYCSVALVKNWLKKYHKWNQGGLEPTTVWTNTRRCHHVMAQTMVHFHDFMIQNEIQLNLFR
jgi:hypothetical protein